jgi:hypothetical protein
LQAVGRSVIIEAMDRLRYRSKPWRSRPLAVVLMLALMALPATATPFIWGGTEVVDLAGRWKFQPGGEAVWAVVEADRARHRPGR